MGQGPMKLFGQTIELQAGHPGRPNLTTCCTSTSSPVARRFSARTTKPRSILRAPGPEMSAMSAHATASSTATASASASVSMSRRPLLARGRPARLRRSPRPAARRPYQDHRSRVLNPNPHQEGPRAVARGTRDPCLGTQDSGFRTRDYGFGIIRSAQCLLSDRAAPRGAPGRGRRAS